MKAAVAALTVLALGGCGQMMGDRKSPYGLWSTGKGQTIEARRNGTYRYCDNGQCAEGKAVAEGNAQVILVGFADMPQTATLRQASGWQEDRDLAARGGEWEPYRVLLSDSSPTALDRLLSCRGRPCMAFGDVEKAENRFIKLKDY